MLNNYIIIALRNLWKHKVDSAISIGGLAVGIACCILLMLFVRFEWSYDSFHEESDRIYRVTGEMTSIDNKLQKSAVMPHAMAATLESAFSEFDHIVRVGKTLFPIKADNKFSTEEVLLADPGFFQIFSFPLISGDAASVLANPDDMVISKEMARQYFGNDDPVGKTITIHLSDEEHLFRVSGIASQVPENSSIKFDMVLPFDTYFRSLDRGDSWGSRFGEIYVLLNRNVSIDQLTNKFPEFVEDHINHQMISSINLQPMQDVYFDEDIWSGSEQSKVLYLWILTGIALVVLVIASINFISLTLSKTSGRSGEIGIRKALGARQSQLGLQFLGEAFIICGFAFFLGIVLAELLVPFFQQIFQKPISLSFLTDPELWFLLGGLMLLTTLITGVYPALIIVREKTIGLFSSRTAAAKVPGIVKGLIIIQFALSISFLVATVTMQQQLHFLFNKDLGFSPSNVISVDINQNHQEGIANASLFAQEAQSLPGVKNVATSNSAFSRHISHGMVSSRHGTTLEELNNQFFLEVIDEHFLQTMDIELLSGRNFSMERVSDISEGIIVNSSFVEAMSWGNPIGQVISDQGVLDNKRVIGVIGDFHFQPLYNNLKPLVLLHMDALNYGSPATIFIKTEEGMTGPTLQRLTALWDEFFPSETFIYSHLDDLLAKAYESEERWSLIIQTTSIIGILLACFGLFGLAALAAQRRTKEIGIRKVMGGSFIDIITLLNKDFLKLVLLGFVIAVPIAWYAMNRWLEDFAYRIEIGPGVFLLAGLLAVIIAFATVSWQSAKAALMNPVNSLRNE